MHYFRRKSNRFNRRFQQTQPTSVALIP